MLPHDRHPDVPHLRPDQHCPSLRGRRRLFRIELEGDNGPHFLPLEHGLRAHAFVGRQADRLPQKDPEATLWLLLFRLRVPLLLPVGALGRRQQSLPH